MPARLTVTFIGVLQGGRDVERAQPSKRVAAAGSDYDRRSVRNGVKLDDKWERQRVCESPSRRRSNTIGVFSVRNPTILILVDDRPTLTA